MDERILQALGMYKYAKAMIDNLEGTKIALRNTKNPFLTPGIIDVGITTIDGIITKLHSDIAQLEVAVPDLILLYED